MPPGPYEPLPTVQRLGRGVLWVGGTGVLVQAHCDLYSATCSPLFIYHVLYLSTFQSPSHPARSFFACVAAVRRAWQVGKSGPTSRAARWSWEPGAGL